MKVKDISRTVVLAAFTALTLNACTDEVPEPSAPTGAEPEIVTVTVTAKPEVVTATETVEVTVTETVTAEPTPNTADGQASGVDSESMEIVFRNTWRDTEAEVRESMCETRHESWAWDILHDGYAEDPYFDDVSGAEYADAYIAFLDRVCVEEEG